MSARLDHLVVAARTLDEGAAWLGARLGVALAPGGEHPDFGTHNRLLSLGPAYLEVIAVNPSVPAPGRPRWFGLDTPALAARLAQGPQLIHWVAAVPALPSRPDVLDLRRGENRWRLTVPPSGELPGGGPEPSLIVWETPAPPTRLPDVGVRLRSLRLGTPEPERLREHLRRLDLVSEEPVEVYRAPGPEVSATLSTPRGAVTL